MTSSLASLRTLIISTSKSFTQLHLSFLDSRMRVSWFDLYACVPAKMTSSCSRTGVCGCRGVRRCLLCEGEATRSAKRDETDNPSLYFCHNCGDVRSSLECREDPASSPLRVCKERCTAPTAAVLRCRARPALTHGATPPFDGVTIVKEFMSREEEAAILSTVDSHTWRDSQSGRRKQVIYSAQVPL